ncbi:MAG: DUF4157 domain-containing protein, partial [Myxococcales bacterium]|nr:DUF4157 domain-containing protein [Myxococcales bacterium]
MGGLHDAVSIGNHDVWGDPLPPHLQRRERDEERGRQELHDEAQTASAHGIAAEGVSGGGGRLPHAERIQEAFGRHDVSGVRAHVGGRAAAASEALGAHAYTTGAAIAFARNPDLHLAAHEAAHVVQQRAGVNLAGGIGAVGDRYERHADEVADAVVRGQSAEGILDRMARGGGSGAEAIQRKPKDGGNGGGNAKDAGKAKGGDKKAKGDAKNKGAVAVDALGIEHPGMTQEELDAQEAKGLAEAEQKREATVAWEGDTTVVLTAFEPGSSALASQHRDALKELNERIRRAMFADEACQAKYEGMDYPWWDAIQQIAGQSSPEGAETSNADLAMRRAEMVLASLVSAADGQVGRPRVTGRTNAGSKAPRSAWPAMRSVRVEAAITEDMRSTVQGTKAQGDAAGARLRAARGDAEASAPSHRPTTAEGARPPSTVSESQSLTSGPISGGVKDGKGFVSSTLELGPLSVALTRSTEKSKVEVKLKKFPDKSGSGPAAKFAQIPIFGAPGAGVWFEPSVSGGLSGETE